MSNFACEKCGTILYDSPNGYTTGCVHYPLPTPARIDADRRDRALQIVRSMSDAEIVSFLQEQGEVSYGN